MFVSGLSISKTLLEQEKIIVRTFISSIHSSNGTEVAYTKLTRDRNQAKTILPVGGQILTIEGSKIVNSNIIDAILISY